MKQPLLRAENLAWTPPNGEVSIFKNAALKVDAGEKIVLQGPSGSGKSSLLRCLVGLEARQSGSVWWREEPVDAASMRRFRQRATYVQQRPSAVAETVGEDLGFARQMAAEIDDDATGNTPDKVLDEDAQFALLARLGLERIQSSRRFEELSVGEQQRVCLVRALTGRPDLLLLDEPTSALDPKRVDQVENLLIDYVDAAPQRRALLWISHDSRQAKRVGSRTLDMRQWATRSEAEHE